MSRSDQAAWRSPRGAAPRWAPICVPLWASLLGALAGCAGPGSDGGAGGGSGAGTSASSAGGSGAGGAVLAAPEGSESTLRLRIVATPDDLDPEAAETARARLFAWLDSNPGRPLASFNALPPSAGGPPAGIEWARLQDTEDGFLPVLEPPFDLWDFGRDDLRGAAVVPDEEGSPGIALEVQESRAADFARFTGTHRDRALAIVVDDVVVSAPAIQDRLEGPFVFRGRFDAEGAMELVERLGLGPLSIEVGP